MSIQTIYARNLKRGSRAALIAGLFLVVQSANAAPVLFAGNGNHYDYIAGNIFYADALAAAAGMSHDGVFGHLATITNAAENAFLSATFGTLAADSFALTAGTDAVTETVWVWGAGPESGLQFSNGALPTLPFNYANWGGVEPNNVGNEDVAVFNIGLTHSGILPGEWADVPDGHGLVKGYLVEYETVVPLPASLPLLLTCMVGLRYVRRKAA